MSPREMIADIRAAGDGCEAAEVLADWMMATLSGGCRAEAVHEMAVGLLPLVRPDFFAWQNKGAQ